MKSRICASRYSGFERPVLEILFAPNPQKAHDTERMFHKQDMRLDQNLKRRSLRLI